MTDLLCVFLPRERREERFFLGFLLNRFLKKRREKKRETEKSVFVMLDEIMLFVCYTSS